MELDRENTVKRIANCKKIIILTLSLLLIALQGCSSFAPGKVDKTLAAFGTAVAQTATAAELQSGGENTLATAQAEATQKSRDVQATQTARALGFGAEQQAEATLAAPIVAELPQFGLDKNSGRVGFVQDPLTLEISGYQQMTHGNDHMEVIAADFVLAADVTWDTQYGSSGCGFMFRSDGKKEKPNMYMVLASRFANGHILFTALADGEIANIHDFYPKTENSSFQWQNGTTNRIAIVARGNIIEIYTNGVKIGEVDTTKPPSRMPSPPKPFPPIDQTNQSAMDAYQDQLKEYQDILKQSEGMFQSAQSNYAKRVAIFKDGFVAFVAASEAGKTICKYSDAWLWLIEP